MGRHGLTRFLPASATTRADDPLEKAEAKKEKGGSATEGIVTDQEAIDEAIGDDGGMDPAETSAQDDPLEKAEASKEAKAK